MRFSWAKRANVTVKRLALLGKRRKVVCLLPDKLSVDKALADHVRIIFKTRNPTPNVTIERFVLSSTGVIP
ncbi:hypothetical protein [Roseovarius sp. D22-M7]|uniref:hypothetical protein n=1 Tax=Roseovarius sp. D22-M7 TaxID=3127116 RepID=UPI0030105665